MADDEQTTLTVIVSDDGPEQVSYSGSNMQSVTVVDDMFCLVTYPSYFTASSDQQVTADLPDTTAEIVEYDQTHCKVIVRDKDQAPTRIFFTLHVIGTVTAQ